MKNNKIIKNLSKFIIVGICMHILISCACLPVFADGSSISFEDYQKNAPTFFYQYGGNFAYVEWLQMNGTFARVYFSYTTESANNSLSVSFDGSNYIFSVKDASSGKVYRTGYYSSNGKDVSFSGSNYTSVNVPATATNIAFYSDCSFDVDPSYPIDRVTSLYYAYPGATYGINGHSFFWNAFNYHTVIEGTTLNGNYDTFSRLYLAYDYADDGYVGIKTGFAGLFSTGHGVQDRYYIAYQYNENGVIFTSQLPFNDFFTCSYIRFDSPSNYRVVYSNLEVRDLTSNVVISATKPVNTDADKIVGAVDDAADQVTDKLDDIYNGEHPYDAPEVDTGAQDDLSDVESGLLDSAQIDMSVLDNAHNFDKSGIPYVGELMSKIIDLGFGPVVIFCLSMGLGLGIVGKRFG